MLKMFVTNSTLAFDAFGDISIEQGDLKVNRDFKAKIQILTDFLRTNYNDYLFYPQYGANYDKFIGRGIDDKLLKELVSTLKHDIEKLEIFPKNTYNVFGLIDKNTIQIRIIFLEQDDDTIFLDFDPVNGVTIGQ